MPANMLDPHPRALSRSWTADCDAQHCPDVNRRSGVKPVGYPGL